MRAFITATILLVSIVALTILNSIYIVNKTDTLLSLCDRIEKDSSAESVDALVTEWQSCRTIIALAVHKSELDRADDALKALKCYASGTQDFDYQLSLVKSALENIADHQKITLDSIL